MISIIIFTLFLSIFTGVEGAGEKLELSVLLRRISALEERLHIQERINEEQDTIIKNLLLERTERTGAPVNGIFTSFDTERNNDSQWEGARGINIGIKSQISSPIQSLVKDLKETSPVLGSRKIQRGIVPGDVAFYSYLSHHETNLGHHQTIVFDEVVTNIGGNYNQYSGIFTSPGNGVYTFSWTLFCNKGALFTSELVVNSAPVGVLYCSALRAGDIRQTSSVAVVRINQGDIVYVRTHPTASLIGEMFSNSYSYSSFCGWKLF